MNVLFAVGLRFETHKQRTQREIEGREEEGGGGLDDSP